MGEGLGTVREPARHQRHNLMANNPRWLLGIYASAVVGRTLTNSVLVSRDLTDESAGSSEKQRH